MKVYISEYGKVCEAAVVKETLKGFRVRVDPFKTRRQFERMAFWKCPHGNHRTFLKKSDAIQDATEYVNDKETKALQVIGDCTKLYADLASA